MYGKQAPPRLVGWRFAAFVGAIFGAVGLAIYPIIIAPMRNPTEWQDISKKIRKEAKIEQENVQPGGMKVWTDPFDRPGKPGHKDEK